MQLISSSPAGRYLPAIQEAFADAFENQDLARTKGNLITFNGADVYRLTFHVPPGLTADELEDLWQQATQNFTLLGWVVDTPTYARIIPEEEGAELQWLMMANPNP